ncbi:MAG: SDR family NAD(P)-dependent oxidoreductase [Mycobacteriales bacterium]
MSQSLVWISGASSGIGRALVDTVPWPGSKIVGLSRRTAPGTQHLGVDLADPTSWPVVHASFRREAAQFTGERVVFVQAAGTLSPIGFAGEVQADDYTHNVVLNSAAPQVLGHMFLEATRDLSASRHLLMLTSGAASSVYPGWSSYGAAKAATDQWVRNVGAEQGIRGGAQVLAVGPGTVDTDMQRQLRETSASQFAQRQKFLDLHEQGQLSDPYDVAAKIWSLLDGGLDSGSVVDLRKLPTT